MKYLSVIMKLINTISNLGYICLKCNSGEVRIYTLLNRFDNLKIIFNKIFMFKTVENSRKLNNFIHLMC
jgi:hypothetical protein